MAYGAVGFGTTPFGATSGATPRVASGFSTTQLGTPFVPFAEGFSSTAFGTPLSLTAFGIYATQFGAPAGSLAFRATALGPTAQISRAFFAFTQPSTASGALGTTFGMPAAQRRRPAGVAQMVNAYGFSTTLLGTPNAAVARGGAAAGFLTTKYGTAAYVPPGAKFASGFTKARLGKPKARTVIGARHASGFLAAQLGTPAAAMRNRAAALAPTSTFGTPLLVRSTSC